MRDACVQHARQVHQFIGERIRLLSEEVDQLTRRLHRLEARVEKEKAKLGRA